MKSLSTFFLVLSLAFVSWQCNTQVKGTNIQGTIQNAGNLQIFLDEITIGQANSVISKSEIGENGQFELAFPEGLEAGVYSLRIGAKRIFLVLDGTENVVNIEGDLATIDRYAFDISGSEDSQSFVTLMQGLVARKVSSEDIRTFVDTSSNPTLGAFAAYSSLGGNYQFLDIQKAAQQKLRQAEPDSDMTREYAKFIDAVEQQYLRQRGSEKVQVGQPAPDITLPGPNGKEYSLSDLKGQIVLLDFWASWCGPCRKENPNVVAVYNKYKDQGFTVFSVSLDGVDSRTLARMGGGAEKEDQLKELSKQRWQQAIEQDNLLWKYHVSDLRKWESQPAALYGVRSIPKAFMIDRDGNIAAVGVRGAAMIEQELQKLL